MTDNSMTDHLLLHELSCRERSEAMVSSRSYYRDDTWDFSDKFPKLPRNDVCVKFALQLRVGLLTDGQHATLLDSLKCLVYSLVFDPPMARISITTVLRAVRPGHGLSHFFIFLADNKIESLRSVTTDDFDDFLDYIGKLPGKVEKITNRTLASRTRGIEWIPLQGDKLFDQLSFTPWDDARSFGAWAKSHAEAIVPRGTLQTQPWSEALVEAMVQLALSVLATASELEKKCIDYRDGVKNHPSIRQHYVEIRSAVGFLAMLFSGMRLTEALMIPAALNKSISVTEVRDGDHLLLGRFIHSTRSKSKTQIEDAWVTIPVVHQAITMLSTIDSILPVKYAYLIHAARFGVERDTSRRLGAKVFMAKLNQLATSHGVDLSEVNGCISSLDFRRTFSRLVTRKGLNPLELKAQLKHDDVSLTMQYGSPGLREHLVAEKHNFTRDQYAELLGGQAKVIGGGSSEIKEMRLVFQGLTRGDKEVFLTKLPKETLVDQTELGLCFYRPHLALCGGRKIACRPDACKNSVIRVEEFSKTLNFRISENMRLARLFARQPAKRAHFKAQLALLNNLKRQIDEGS